MMKFSSSHDSNAVVTWAKFCHDLINIIWLIDEKAFNKIWIIYSKIISETVH